LKKDSAFETSENSKQVALCQIPKDGAPPYFVTIVGVFLAADDDLGSDNTGKIMSIT
jgi:hypothetical protein